jgi:hypothetical protein
MTAPRSCRRCGATLPTDVRWCLRCYAPIQELTPRDRQLPALAETEILDPRSVRPDYAPLRTTRKRLSRTVAGPMSFGLVGRLALTALIVVLLPWSGWIGPLGIVYSIGFLPIAVAVLRATWAPTPVDDGRVFVLPASRALSALRWALGLLAVAMIVVAVASGGSPLAIVPGASLLASTIPVAWRAVELGLADALERPVVLAISLNALNVLDVMASNAAIHAGQANELNPFVGRAGTGAKLMLVLVCSVLLLRIHPRALLWPVAAFTVLAAYHLTGWLLMV